MRTRERVSLAELTTLKVGGIAGKVAECASEEEVAAAVASNRGSKLFILGGGSNVLASDTGFDGLVLKVAIPGLEFEEQAGGGTVATVGAGIAWDEFVAAAAARGLWGVENLAGIPGTVGAAPVQNIGAYGAELADTFLWSRALSRADGSPRRFSREEAAFAYRDSIFKREQEWIITRAAFRLKARGEPNLAYADLAQAQETGAPLETPAEVGKAVRGIRAKKFPNLEVCGTAGSFFKNPIIACELADALALRYPGLPQFAQEGGQMKVPLAWILDHILGLKGHARGYVRLFEHQPLVLVTESGATASDVETFADSIAEKVFDATGIKAEREVQSLA